MGRDKRKSRLDKGGSSGGEFVGFGAFAAPSASLKASPVYTGSDTQLSLLFKKITQKRDAVTKTRALNELQEYFEQDHNRKDQVDALSHLVFVYHSKISYDDASSVRAAAISCLNAARLRLPKAWNTLVTEQQPEVSGMMWCGRADSAAEVRMAAAVYDDASQVGVIQYVARILAYDRPRVMHDALFARKQETEPPDRDELDERYERIVGGALGGIGLWIQEHPETEDSTYQDAIKNGILWSTLNSSRSSLRRKTYSLLSILCQYAKSLAYDEAGLSTLPKLLTNALTQEKDAINIPSLLEVLLLFLSNFPDSGNPWNVVDAPMLVKSLGKQLKKACHGASANQWAPTMLPLLALISDDTFVLQLQLLKNMLTGMEATIGPGDNLLIAAAVAECSSFFLLRRETDSSQIDVDVAKQFAEFWLQILGQYLMSETTSSMAKEADESLLQNLSQSLGKLDESSCRRPQSAIFRVQNWFWSEAIEFTVLETSGSIANQRWAELLNSVMTKRPKEALLDSRLKPVIRKRFHATLSKFQGESGSAPTVQADDLMIASVKYCGAQYLFEEDGGSTATFDHFLTNDILRWIVMSTSSLSTRKGRKALVKLEFALLGECLVSVTSPLKQKSLWETILRESIAANCDLELLADGLQVLMNEPATLEIIRCEEMNEFAVKVGEETTRAYRNHYLKESFDVEEEETYQKEAMKASTFLRTCSGLSPERPTPLVSQNVVHRWAEEAAPDASEHVFELEGTDAIENPLVATLLSLISRGDVSLFSPEDANRIIMESWRHGGKHWNEDVMPLLLNQGVVPERQHICSSDHIVQRGTKELRDILEFFCGSSDDDLAHVALICHVWSERALRILCLCSEVAVSSEDNDASIPVPSLALVGLADTEMWRSALNEESSVSHLYLCLVYLLQQYQTPSDRLDLLLQSTDSSAALMKNILVAISDAAGGVIVDPVTRRDRKCALVLALLGGKDIPNDLLLSWCRVMIDDLSAAMKSSCVRVTRSVSVLSELLFTIFDRVVVDERLNASTADMVDASVVHEGDELWYVAGDDDKDRSRARVVKVHSDDFPRLYFTIQVEQDDGATQERQTVAERLRKLSRPPDTIGDAVISSSFSKSERAERVRFGDVMFEELVKPVLLSTLEGRETPVVDGASECLNMIISHCGLVGKEGLASTRYEVFKLLSSLQTSVVQSIVSEGSISSTTQFLRVLSLAMGLGYVVPASKNNFKLIKFTPDESVKAIVEHYNSEEVDIIGKTGLDRAVLEWLAVSIGEVASEAIRKVGAALLCRLSNGTMIQTKGGIMSDANRLANSVLVMRAVQNAEIASCPCQEDTSSAQEDEQEAVTSLVKSFSLVWENASESVCQYEVLDESMRTSSVQLPEWYEPFQSLLSTLLEHQRGLVAVAAKSNCDSLVENLFSSDKRWLAFKLLIASADGEPLRLDFFTGDSTQRRLKTWQEGLIEEEAEELEDDVGLVGQWVPEALMNELESWEDRDEFDSGDQVTAMGRMLCWLCFLSFVDSSAAVDVRFRGSVSAYLSYVDVDNVLATALSYLNLNAKERNSKQKAIITMQDVLAERSSLELSKIAGLVIFRTIQAFPTVFKNWWENDCPKNRSTAVSQFVETMVAPEALRRELERINNASDLGEMTVSGSAVSREVTATYMQDECQLSIAVQLPPNFPLRNVEVDGRLTLGVPEKRWKRWALQIRQMLNNQDGTLLDALMLWKENVDKDFAGLEPCPVCYSILSVKTHELPNLECNTCNNVFHSSCLYKWFHSSGKSSCVLCQQPWSGTRIQRGS